MVNKDKIFWKHKVRTKNYWLGYHGFIRSRLSIIATTRYEYRYQNNQHVNDLSKHFYCKTLSKQDWKYVKLFESRWKWWFINDNGTKKCQ